MTTAIEAEAERWQRPTRIDARLQGWWLTAARGIGIAAAALSMACLGVALPASWSQFITPSATLRADLGRIGLPVVVYAGGAIAIEIVVILSFFGIAALLFQRRSSETIALLASVMLLGIGVSALTGTFQLLPSLWRLVANGLSQIGWDAIFVFCYVFPDGYFTPRWTRWFAVGLIAPQLGVLVFPGAPINPNHWPPLLGALSVFALFGSCLISQVYRYRRVSTPAQRQQTKWVVFGLAAMLAILLPYNLLTQIIPSLARGDSAFGALRGALVLIPYPLIPLAIGIAILRYRLWDIDVIINRSLVYGGLTALVIVTYVVTVGALAELLQIRGNLLFSLVATGIVAILFQPLRERLQRGINRLMYGERDDPYAVLSRLGQRLEATLATDTILPTIVQTITEALKLPYAAITLEPGDATTVAAAGVPVSSLLPLPLTYQQEMVGTLYLAPRVGGESFTPTDRRLLDDLARQVGVAAHAVRLTNDLQRSRQRLITAREEERRRLRRDLHDGLGPSLASMTMQAEAARDLIGSVPAMTEELLTDLVTQLQEATADIRRLVYALRPPALDDLGLIAALRAHATRYEQSGLQVSIDAPVELPLLPAAVEVAAYRITLEALTNVARHAQARVCMIVIRHDEFGCWLRVEIADDGRGIVADTSTGLGLTSMRERAEELGGNYTIEPNRGGGTRVCALLPLGSQTADRASPTPPDEVGAIGAEMI